MFCCFVQINNLRSNFSGQINNRSKRMRNCEEKLKKFGWNIKDLFCYYKQLTSVLDFEIDFNLKIEFGVARYLSLTLLRKSKQ